MMNFYVSELPESEKTFLDLQLSVFLSMEKIARKRNELNVCLSVHLHSGGLARLPDGKWGPLHISQYEPPGCVLGMAVIAGITGFTAQNNRFLK
ncbi:hypothetical protein AVEN_224429-1 [Araneus ventricosus]|uniref:Uncharacterized protein n=1 Tax=Araneus ventricosus TaxID=182803 RepID=A0A4Y2U7H4_ARAVE|nr:hypothetical protein AVEN_224429-1 [Araneus ventricosus]